MKDHIKKQATNPEEVRMTLKNPAERDLHILQMAQQDKNCLSCRQEGPVFCYRRKGYATLETFLNHYTFEGEKGYGFLLSLFEHAIRSNRAKPILFEPDAVFVSLQGDEIRFIALPLKTELWLLQKEKTRQWTKTVRKLYRTTTAYEIAGYLMVLENSRGFSMPALVQGLRDLYRKYHPRRFSFLPEKEISVFQAREAIRVFDPDPQILPPTPGLPEKTQLLEQPSGPEAVLEREGEVFGLPFEQMKVGRGMQCDIRLPY